MVRTVGVIALFLAMLWQLPVQAESEMKPKVGVQLYSVRDALQADFEGTLRALAEMGFDGVELYGGVYGPYVDERVKLKAFLESLGLESAGSYVASDDLSEANLAELLRFHQAFIGEGETNWNALLDANFEVGGTQWLLVEQEAYPDDMTPLQAVE